MVGGASNYLKEFVRCTRHSVLHLRVFNLGYGRGVWRVRDGDVRMNFPFYPYLAFHDIEGYLNEGRWRPEPGMTVVDAGGCNGEFALYASKRVGPSGRVLMLEPDPANATVARRVFEMNGSPPNIEIVSAGLWSRPGKLRFNTGQGAESAVVMDDAPAGPGTMEIDVHSLTSLADAYRLDRLDMVKMDIEGAELEVISAAPELHARFKPRYAIASYHVVNGRRAADVLAELFPKMGYHCRMGYPEHLTTWASPTASD